jgi:hypothetical protein
MPHMPPATASQAAASSFPASAMSTFLAALLGDHVVDDLIGEV